MTTPVPPPRLLNPVAAKARLLQDSIRTEQASIDWIRRFILFHNKKHPWLTLSLLLRSWD